MGAVRVLVIGGGVAGLEGMLALRALAGERVSICVIAPEEDFVYRPLAVAEPFHVAEMRTIALRSLVSSAGAELISARVTAVDAQQHVVRTQAGSEIPYDFLLVTGGTTPHEAVPGSLTFRGPRDQDAFADLLDAAVMGRVHRIIFALPSGVSWILPLYELALLTAEYLGDRGTPGIEISIVTPEESPLSLFGIQASEAVRELLEVRGIGLRTHTTPVSFENGVLGVLSGEKLAVDQVVSLPRLEGAHIDGLPYESAGFVRTDGFGHVDELPDVFAAGDITGFPIKQGGIAAQQADAVAETIAAHAGERSHRHPSRRSCAGCSSPASSRVSSTPSLGRPRRKSAPRLSGCRRPKLPGRTSRRSSLAISDSTACRKRMSRALSPSSG